MGNQRVKQPNDAGGVPRRIATHWAGRINGMDLSRATEQSALVAAAFLGRKKEWELRDLAIPAMHGYLRYAAASALNIVFADGKDVAALGSRDSIAVPLREPVRLADGVESQTALELCIAPIDGKRAAAAGTESGSMSVLAAGRTGSFADPWAAVTKLAEESKPPASEADVPPLATFIEGGTHADRYLVVAVSAELRDLATQAKLQSLFTPAPPAGEPVMAELANRVFGDAVANAVRIGAIAEIISKQLASRPTAAVVAHGGSKGEIEDWMDPVRKHFRVRRLEGSSIAGMLTALLHDNATHVAFAIARRTHVILAAAAARALGGEIFAMKLTPVHRLRPRKKSHAERELRGYSFASNHVFGSADFVPGEDVVFLATGISDHPALRGVRFPSGKTASTSSLCLNVRTGSRRRLEHDIDMDRYRFYPDSDTEGPTTLHDHLTSLGA